MPIKKHDFIEVEYTGKLKDGTVFDTTSEKIAKENNIYNKKATYGPVIVCLGEKQILPGLDEFLEGKEIGQEYQLELPPEKAFGKKDAQRIRLIPARAFKKTDIEPQPGLQITVDDEAGTILRASGGRILVDFNHPLAGKEVLYQVKVNKKINEPKEKIRSYLELALNLKDFGVDIKEKTATITLPFEMPPELQEKIKEKLTEITEIKDIKFVKKESQQKTVPKDKDSSPKQ